MNNDVGVFRAIHHAPNPNLQPFVPSHLPQHNANSALSTFNDFARVHPTGAVVGASTAIIFAWSYAIYPLSLMAIKHLVTPLLSSQLRTYVSNYFDDGKPKELPCANLTKEFAEYRQLQRNESDRINVKIDKLSSLIEKLEGLLQNCQITCGGEVLPKEQCQRN